MISECRERREMRREERSEVKYRASRGEPRERSQSLRTEFRFVACIFRSDSRALKFARDDAGFENSASGKLAQR
jgi:hypothetical protein